MPFGPEGRTGVFWGLLGPFWGGRPSSGRSRSQAGCGVDGRERGTAWGLGPLTQGSLGFVDYVDLLGPLGRVEFVRVS